MSKDNASKSRKGEVISVEFRPAKGGVVSETRTKYKRGGQGGGPMDDYEHETAVHSTKEDAAAHLHAALGKAWGGSDGPDRETKADEEG